MVYSTFIGGNGSSFNPSDHDLGDQGNSIAIDSEGNAYITGYTRSTDFPVTLGAYQSTLDYQSVFVTKLNSTGTGLIYSTYIGGGGSIGHSIAIDNNGNIYITGETYSLNYPTTGNAYQQSTSTYYNHVFVTKLNSTGTTLIYSTYIGGGGNRASSIAVDDSGNAYITGQADSNYPTTEGAYQTNTDGLLPAFVTKLNSEGSSLIYSTFIGGEHGAQGNSIALDINGNAYITGWTWSSDYPTTINAFQDSLGDSGADAFVTKLNSTGSDLIYSTYLGVESQGESIAVDSSANAYITGGTTSPDFPTTKGAYQTNFPAKYPANTNVFVTKLNASGSSLEYSTYIGGSGNINGGGEFARSIAIDIKGNAYITGNTGSNDFPTTSGAYETIGGGLFITMLNSMGNDLVYSTIINRYGWGESIAVDSNRNAYITGQAFSGYPTTNGAFQTAVGSSYGNAYVTKFNLSAETSVEEYNFSIPSKFLLEQNYPNPFNPSTTIEYSIPKQSNVIIKVFDLLGKEIATLVNAEKRAGVYKVNFNGSNLASGIYFYRIEATPVGGQAGNFIETKKLVLLK